jgi:hypothetical protein
MLEPVGNKDLADLVREAMEKMKHDSPGQLEVAWHDDSEKTTIYRVREVKSAKGTPLSLR